MAAGEFPAGYNQFASIFVSVARWCFKNEPVIVGIVQFISASDWESALANRCWTLFTSLVAYRSILEIAWENRLNGDWNRVLSNFSFLKQGKKWNKTFVFSFHTASKSPQKKENWEEKISPSAVRCSIMQSNDLWSSIALSTTSQVNCRRLSILSVSPACARSERRKLKVNVAHNTRSRLMLPEDTDQNVEKRNCGKGGK